MNNDILAKADSALRALNAELVDTLTEYVRLRGCHGEYRAWSEVKDALARATSPTPVKHVPETDFGNIPQATPAPHPDTVRLDWLAEVDTYQRLHAVRLLLPITGYPTSTATDPVRAAIDAAMNRGAA